MPKVYSQFVCQQCGYETPQWLGRCPECGEWNTLVETIRETAPPKKGGRETYGAKPQKLSEIAVEKIGRLSTGFEEFDRVLGGGMVAGSVILLAGDPGIGKSTLLLQVALGLAAGPGPVLYVSGEESPQQLKMRAQRLNQEKGVNLLLLAETNVENALTTIEEEKPGLVIVDSIQTMWTDQMSGTPGSVGQVKECAARLLKTAKKAGFPLFLVGHVTKEGAIAGPMVLSHLVDTVLYLEGERFQTLKILRAVKNRFGPTDEVGIFQMAHQGMVEVQNPSEVFLASARRGQEPGSVVVATLEGTRPILAEIQALVVRTQMPVPKRLVSGLDFNRVGLLAAVLQKRLNLPLYLSDIFLNVAGGLRVFEPAADLGIALAIISSFKNKALPQDLLAIGEVGLLGEVRSVPNLEKRIKEGKRFGFKKLVTPQDFQTLAEVAQKVF